MIDVFEWVNECEAVDRARQWMRGYGGGVRASLIIYFTGLKGGGGISDRVTRPADLIGNKSNVSLNSL